MDTTTLRGNDIAQIHSIAKYGSGYIWNMVKTRHFIGLLVFIEHSHNCYWCENFCGLISEVSEAAFF